jgi:putative protease
VATDHIDLHTNAPMANGDGLNYLHKRETFGIQANTVKKLGEDEEGQQWRVFPNEQISALPGLKVGMTIMRNRDHHWEGALNKKSSERKVGLHLTLSEHAGGLRLSLCDEDGTPARPTPPSPSSRRSKPSRPTPRCAPACQAGRHHVRCRQRGAEAVQPWFVPSAAINALRATPSRRMKRCAWPHGTARNARPRWNRRPSSRTPSSATWPTSTTRKPAPSTTSTACS